MTSRGGHPGRRKPSLKIPQTGGSAVYVERRVIDQIKEATKATEEDIQLTLTECSGDVNEATARLIESPFTVVTSKRKVKQVEERKKPAEKGLAARGNSNVRPGDAATKQNRGPDGGPGAANNLKGKGGSKLAGGLRTANRPRVEEGSAQEGGQGKQQQASRAPNNRAKEPVAEKGGVAAMAQPAPPTPMKVGYADALCRGINKPAVKDVAYDLQGMPIEEPPKSQRAEAYQPPVWPKHPKKAPIKPAEESREEEKVMNGQRQQACQEQTIPFDDLRAISSPESKEEADKAIAAAVPQEADKLAEVDEVGDRANVAIDGPELRDVKQEVQVAAVLPQAAVEDSMQQENSQDKILPSFLAPILDLLLEEPPIYESSLSLTFGSFPGVQTVLKQKEVRITEVAGHPLADDRTDVAPHMDSTCEKENQIEMTTDAQSSEVIPESYETQELGDEAIVSSVPGPITYNEPEPEHRAEPINDASTIAAGDMYSRGTAEGTTTDGPQEVDNGIVPPKETEMTSPAADAYDASTSAQHTAPVVPNPSQSVQEYGKSSDNTFQSSQYPDIHEPTPGQEIKQQFTPEGQVAAVHHQRQHQQMQDRSAYETGQHSANPAPTIPPYHRQKQEERSTPAHAGHQQHHNRFVGQVSTGAQTDANSALSNQTAGGNTAAASVPGGVVAAPPVRPAQTPTPHVPQVPYANPMIPSPAMPFPAHYYPQYMQAHQFNAMAAAYHGIYPGTYGYSGAFSHGAESSGYPAPHLPPGGSLPKYLPPYNAPGANAINQAYAANYPAAGIYGLGSNAGYEASGGVSGYAAYKEKDNLPQGAQQHNGYGPGIGQQGPRNDLYYSQGYSGQAFRNQGYHHQGYGGQFGGAGPPPHNFHNVAGQQNNFRLH